MYYKNDGLVKIQGPESMSVLWTRPAKKMSMKVVSTPTESVVIFDSSV